MNCLTAVSRCWTARIVSWCLTAIASALAIGPVHADQITTSTIGETLPYFLDTGELSNPLAEEAVVFVDLIQIPGSAWLRLYFDAADLEKPSRVRVTSVADGEAQELDAVDMARWSRSTAYLNGDAVLLEVIAGPGTENNRLVMSHVTGEFPAAEPRGGAGQVGICGADERVPSSEQWAARVLPIRCSSSVTNQTSCMVTAGHCATDNMVAQFNVPPSNANCTLNNPPVADQFPITSFLFDESGVGEDWCVMTPGPNNLGQRPFDRYGVFRSISATAATAGQTASITGYGRDAACEQERVQQTASGTIQAVNATSYQFGIDLRDGSSGSALLRSNQIVGIITHAGCPDGAGNVGTRVDRPAFAAARSTLCFGPQNDFCGGAINIGDENRTFNSSGAGTDGPDEPAACDFDGYTQIGADIWFRYTASCTGTVTVDLCQSFYDTKAAVYDGGGCPQAAPLACNDDACGTSGNRSLLTFPSIAGSQYLIRVGGFNGATGSGRIITSCQPDDLCSLLGDINGDGAVLGDDIEGFVRAKLGIPPLPGESPLCADYGQGSLAGDVAMFLSDLLGN